MTKWVFSNNTEGSDSVPITSADHAVELLMEASGWNEFGIVLDFIHAERGYVSCIAWPMFATLSFCPNYNRKAHSLVGTRNAKRVKPVTNEPLFFVDNTGVASSTDIHCLLPILKVAKGLKWIIEHHDFPTFIRWSNATLAS